MILGFDLRQFEDEIGSIDYEYNTGIRNKIKRQTQPGGSVNLERRHCPQQLAFGKAKCVKLNLAKAHFWEILLELSKNMIIISILIFSLSDLFKS